MATDVARHRFTVADYHRMIDAGILTEDDRVELLGGEIVEMTPIGSGHAGCVNRLTRLLIERLARRAVVTTQNPVILDDFSEPEPDIAVCRPRSDDYADGHPRPDDVLLLIEVAQTTQAFDREVKFPRYGRTGVPEAWLVDLEAGVVEVHSRPGPDSYAERTLHERGNSLAPSAIADLTVEVDEILG